MKKLMTVLVSIGVVGSAAAYDMQIQNFTAFPLRVEIHYGGKGVCSVDQKTMDPWTTRTYGTKACCAKLVKFSPSGGTKAGKWFTFEGLKYGGFGLSCTTNRIFVQMLPDGTLGLERSDKKLPIK